MVSSFSILEFFLAGTLRGASIILRKWPQGVRNYVSVYSGLYRPKWRPRPEEGLEEHDWGLGKERSLVTPITLCFSPMKAVQPFTQGYILRERSSHTWSPEFLVNPLWLLAYPLSPRVCPLTTPPPLAPPTHCSGFLVGGGCQG